MENIKNYIKEHTWIDIVLIAIVVFMFTILFGNHISFPFAQQGREFFLSEQILKGHVPFKDVTMVNLPFAYYVNALILRILGISLNSLLIVQSLFCALFSCIFYLLSKEFLNRRISVFLTLLIISACIFSSGDLYSFIVPYSYSASYGYMGFVVCTYFLIKLFKTDNVKYAYLSALLAGFCLANGIEFIFVVLFLPIVLFWYKKIRFWQYINIFLLTCFFPIIESGILILQGVSLDNITEAFNLFQAYIQTDVLHLHLAYAGMLPIGMITKLKYIAINTPYVINIFILCFITLMLCRKFRYSGFILILGFVYIWISFFNRMTLFFIWDGLPLIIFVLFCILLKKYIKEEKVFLVLLLSAIFISQKSFFSLNMLEYGTYSLPLLLLSLIAALDKLMPKEMINIKFQYVINFVLIVLLCFYSANLYLHKQETGYAFRSHKGTIYLTKNYFNTLKIVNEFIDSGTYKKSSVLVLPEGNIINFLTDRDVSPTCYMMDRLYYDAYGSEDSRNLMKDNPADNIIVINSKDINNYDKNYLYAREASSVERYISKYYKKVNDINIGTGKFDEINIKIYKLYQ